MIHHDSRRTIFWRSVDTHFQDGVGSALLSLYTMKTANTSFMAVSNLSPLRLCGIYDEQLLMLHWRSFSGWGREHVSLCFDHDCGQYIKERQLHTKVNILRWTVAYLNLSINGLSRKPEPEIGTDWSSKTLQNPQNDGYGYGFGQPRCSRSGFKTGLEPNWTILAVQTRITGRLPGPIANTKWETYFLSHKENEKWIEDYVHRDTTMATKQVEDAETVNQQQQDDMTNDQKALMTTRKPEETIALLLNPLRDSLRDVTCSDDKEDTEEEEVDDDDTVLGRLSNDYKPGCVIQIFSEMVL